MTYNNLEKVMEYGCEKYITVDGMDIRYAVRGKGSPLLLLHGFCEFLETWDFNFRSLGEYYQVYAMDLPGHGLSDKPYINYNLPFFAEFIADFMQALGISQADVVGHSFGGAIGMKLADIYPDRVGRLVLESSFGLSKDVSLIHKLCSVPVLSSKSKTGLEKQDALDRRVGLEFYKPDFAAREIVSRSYLFMQMPEARRVMLNIMHNWIDVDGLRPDAVMVDRLPMIKTPTLLIHCEKDNIHPVELSRSAWHIMPNAKLKTFNECGHCPHIEKATEFNQAVIEFLQAR